MKRRAFLQAGLAAGLAAGLPGCRFDGSALFRPDIRITRPGMDVGHVLRDRQPLPPVSGEIRTDVAILGSGVAGLTAGWRLAREGFGDFVLVTGPEPFGNATAIRFGDVPCPTGAHYLPLPTPASAHVRTLLGEMKLVDDAFAAAPDYDEAALVHAPESRLWINGRWQGGVQPHHGIPASEVAEQQHFYAYTESLKQRLGRDGRRLFEIPLALSSSDPEWRALDAETFAHWLARNDYTAPSLLWYLDYCCRDDFGTGLAHTSAWAGLHYFASRNGSARNGDDAAVLTWADGLNTPARHLLGAITPQRTLAGSVVRVSERRDHVEALVLQYGRLIRIRARRAVIAMPLFVAGHIVEGLKNEGFDPAIHTPEHAPWLVANFAMDHFPSEKKGEVLAWDNVVYQGKGLGYVVATHQLIRAARPERTVFTAYHALADGEPRDVRRWLAGASADELYDLAASDLAEVYGWKLTRNASAVEITLRGHAMPSPRPGFLGNAGTQALAAADGRLLFAHSDLSGYSVFEEAAWWGWHAAGRILGT
ncbi:NAD(P)/FAD-dependent oxidoreductase [Jeongeupia naejangsanensis]|uniref:NAD(P)-binding protein n=1 Tax=Jeongeupia naejangsanensis TaxID=613195 RepID=A0ABS2BQY0_9NEIS|nr:NAD(P)/FAD-dependent oxidoreductase [Jeongeupia naejangsanensis]MBM3117458.1 NAD(P)-binding protein [Jeongeupia naejangsanensis]